MSELIIQYVPHAEIEPLSGDERIKKLLKIVKEDKIVLLEGQLRKNEEANLIQMTMEAIDKRFKGIELAVIYPSKENASLLHKIRDQLASMLLGPREGLTIIGPATMVREIKQDPNKIQLFTVDRKKK